MSAGLRENPETGACDTRWVEAESNDLAQAPETSKVGIVVSRLVTELAIKHSP